MAITVTVDNEPYTIKTLLGDGDSNFKLAKSDKSGKDFLTFGLSLAPANTSGYQTCASSSPGCRAACLFTAGMGAFSNVRRARVAKTKAFFEQRNTFVDMLTNELESARRKANKQGKVACVRLNVVSDIMWERTVPSLFTTFSDIQFYDYTKHYKRMLSYCLGIDFPKNYHLTFSRSECNDKEVREILLNKGNVTVVFQDKLPKWWMSYKVINGDKTDLRFLDPKGVVVGLKAKGKGRKDDSGFVVKPNTVPLQVL